MSNKFNTHELIERAWCDKTDFEAISETESLNENDVKKILRKNLKKRSYVLWRKRIAKIKSNKKLSKLF
ncbi:MAG: DUF2805 domain-containing protein [Alphaproteobacteria bacterium TMED93]|nr:MAG: DUF2805 domain-containing protein [Alphaproteobacteria bacterium TMED93]